MSLFDDCFESIVGIEGGYSNNPADSGGETKYGITVKVARAYGYYGAMKDLPLPTAKAIYKRDYWDVLKCAGMEPILAEAVFNIGVNAGNGRAGKFLQYALNAFNNQGKLWPDIAVDGGIGPGTLSALAAYMKARKEPFTLTKAVLCQYGAFLLQLSQDRSKDEAFVYGWIKHRINL